MAGPFSPEDFEKLIPANKKLDPNWLRSLTARGEPTLYRGEDTKWIGMPVGGIGCGQLYLGGDGKLWHWDILNLPQAQNFSDTSGPNYSHPPRQASPFEQGFAIRIKIGDRVIQRTLDRKGFPHVAFQGQYPVGKVMYHDPDFPARVTLEAFSPFIPLNTEDSCLPATILSYEIENTGKEEMEIELAGWLENPVCLGSGKPGQGSRIFR
ncbi:MAG: GH116 family glycosyl-hydrolase, partial [Gemmataceae bacterium]